MRDFVDVLYELLPGMGIGAAIVLAVVGIFASYAPKTGTERGPCYGNGTCNGGLVCLSEVCVKTEGRP